MDRAQNLYIRVVDITTDYLGPAADRFIARQIRNHLKKNPERLLEKDLEELVDWVEIAMSFLTNDVSIVNKYIDELKKLTIKDSVSK